MKQLSLPLIVLVLFSLCLPAHSRQWKAAEKIVHYSIQGKTGSTLYRSIGKNGPVLKGNRRTIAITDWDLKWRRDYKPKGKACKLVSAKPFFTITYTMPKPASKLRNPTAGNWQAFYQGILTHEKVHGVYAVEMVHQIINQTVGLTIKNDPKCQKIRAEVLKRVKQAYRDYKSKGRVFDGMEMARGGNVRQLVMQLLDR